MAKTPKLKTKPQSLKSRAARRASSPSLNLDKSLKNLPRPNEDSKPNPNPLSARHSSGVMKKKAKSKPQTRAQKLRLQKGIEKAEKVIQRTEKKVERSKGRGTVAKERATDWEVLNEKIVESEELKEMVLGRQRVKKSSKGKEDEEEWDDMEVEDGGGSGLGASMEATSTDVIASGPTLVVVDRTATAELDDVIT